AAHRQFGAFGPPAEIGPNIETLPWRQHYVGESLGRLQKTAVDADHGQRRSIAPAQFVNACVGAIEETQAVGAAGDFELGIRTAVDQDAVAVESHHAIVHVRTVNQLVLSVESTVLEHDGNLVLAGRQFESRLL